MGTNTFDPPKYHEHQDNSLDEFALSVEKCFDQYYHYLVGCCRERRSETCRRKKNVTPFAEYKDEILEEK